MVSTSLAFRILAQDEGASKTLERVGVTAGVTEGRLSLLSRATGKFGSATRDAFKLAGAALVGAGLVEGLKDVWTEAQHSNLVTKQTEAVIKSTGQAAHVTADQVGDLATALSMKNAVDDEAIQSGENLLLTFTGIRNEAGKGNDIFNQTTQAVIDMTAAMNGGAVTEENIAATSIRVGKALNDPIKGITALTKAGVVFTDQQKQQITTLVKSGDTLDAQKIILKELSKEFGGSAEAAATGAKRLGIVIGNVKETIGQGLVRVVDSVSNDLAGKLPGALDAAGRAFGMIEDPLKRIGHDFIDWERSWFGLATQVVKPLAILAGGAIVGGLHLLADALDLIDQNKGVLIPLATGALAFVAASKAIGGITILWKLAGSAIETLALKALYAKDAMIGLATGETAAKVAGVGMGAAMGPVGIAVAAVSIGVGILAAKHMGAKAAAQEHASAVEQFSRILRDNNGALNDNVVAQRTQELESKGLLAIVSKIGFNLNDYTQATLGNTDAQHRFADALTHAKDTGELSFEEFSKLGSGTVDYIGVTKDAIDANGRLAEANTKNTGATNQNTNATQRAKVAAEAAKKADDDLWTSLNKLANINLTAASSHLAVQQAILSVDTSLKGLDATTKKDTQNLNVNTVAGASARQQLISNVQAILADGEAQKARGKSTAQATKTMQDDLAVLKLHYHQLGYNDTQVNQLIGSLVTFGKQHPTATAKVNTSQADSAIKTVTRHLDYLDGRLVRVYVDAELSGSARSPILGQSIAVHAGGGLWSGWSWTGEAGPELSYTSPHDTTATFTAKQSRDMVTAFRGGQGGGVQIGTLNVNVSGATGREAALEVAREIKKLERGGFAVSMG